MAISEGKLREMRENSRVGAAKQQAKEQAALDKYMYMRDTEVKNYMTAKERNAAIKKAYNEEGKSVERIVEAFGLTTERVNKILGISEKPSGVIDAAELSNEQREELTAQAEADAGVYYNGEGESASDIAYDEDECEGRAREPYECGPFTDEPKPRQTADKPRNAIEIGDVYLKGIEIMTLLRTVLDVPENIILNLNVTEGLCELEVADTDDIDRTARFTWRL